MDAIRSGRKIALALGVVILAIVAVTVHAPANGPAAADADPAAQGVGGVAQKNLLLIAIAGVFVAIYWLDRFNVPDRRKASARGDKERFRLPATNRSSTTALRYYSAATTYCLTGLALYVLLVFSPEAWKELARGMEAGSRARAGRAERSVEPVRRRPGPDRALPEIAGLQAGGRLAHEQASLLRGDSRRSTTAEPAATCASDDPAIETHTFAANEDVRRAVARAWRASSAMTSRPASISTRGGVRGPAGRIPRSGVSVDQSRSVDAAGPSLGSRRRRGTVHGPPH